MKKSDKKDDLSDLAHEVRELGQNLGFNTGFLLLYDGLLIGRYIEIHLAKEKLTRSRIGMLNTLVTYGPSMKPSEIAKRTFRSTQTVTKSVDNLERDGLVRREALGKDRRTREVTITGKGIELVKQMLPEVLEVSAKALPPMTERKMKELNSMLRKIRKHLTKVIAEGEKRG